MDASAGFEWRCVVEPRVAALDDAAGLGEGFRSVCGAQPVCELVGDFGSFALSEERSGCWKRP